MKNAERLCLAVGLTAPRVRELTALLPFSDIVEECRPDGLAARLAKDCSCTQGILVFISASTWGQLGQAERAAITQSADTQFVLVADVGEDSLEYLAGGQFLTVLTLPFETEKITRVLRQFTDAQFLYEDIFQMAREIGLEREILARKNAQLDFLNRVLTTATTFLEPEAILSSCLETLELMISVENILAVFWDTEQQDAEMFIPEQASDAFLEESTQYLMQVARKFGRVDIRSFQTTALPVGKSMPNCETLEQSRLVTLPLEFQNQIFGALVLCSQEASLVGREKMQTLHAAARHLALALRNGLQFQRLRVRADRDGLTRIANRQSFDMRLREEMKRHQRHHDELSVLMIDLDYFKSINDTYGHLTGDRVLYEVSSILKKSLRESDFPARYGGEEFVILLPQTAEEQAWILAERIRKRIAQYVFTFQQKSFRVTASFGVAGLRPDPFTPAEVLLSKADSALYEAKYRGRNMVCCSSMEGQAQVSEA